MPWVYDPGHSVIEFGAKHLGIAVLKGRFFEADVSISLDEEDIIGSSFEATIDAASVNVFHERATELFKSEAHLEVARYPTITFRSRRIEPNGDRYTIVGDLTLHGVTREIGWQGTYNGQATDHFGRTRRGYSLSTVVELSDFGVPEAERAGEGGDERVQVSLEVELVRRDEDSRCMQDR